MKIRKSLNVMLALVVGLSLSACTSGNNLSRYLKAEEKTGNMSSGQVQLQAQASNKWDDFDTRYAYEFDRTFDRESEQSISHIYILQNNLGTDMTLYEISPEEKYLKLPMFPGYMDLSGQEEASENQSSQNLNASDLESIQEIFQTIGQQFRGSLKDENVFKEDKILVDTPDGKVKATQYTIVPSEALLNVIGQKITELDDQQRQGISSAFNVEEDALSSIWKALDEGLRIEAYDEKVYVNMDGYVIQKNIKVILHFDSDHLPQTMTLDLQINNSQINQALELPFPEISPDEIYTSSDLQEAY